MSDHRTGLNVTFRDSLSIFECKTGTWIRVRLCGDHFDFHVEGRIRVERALSK